MPLQTIASLCAALLKLIDIRPQCVLNYFDMGYVCDI